MKKSELFLQKIREAEELLNSIIKDNPSKENLRAVNNITEHIADIELELSNIKD